MFSRTLALVFLGGWLSVIATTNAQTTQSARAVDIVQEYASNEIAAGQKYEGHRISLGGIVAGVGIDPDQNPYVVLSGTDRPDRKSGAQKNVTQLRNYAGYLKCIFTPADKAKIAGLRVGSATGFQGTVAAKFKGGVLAKDCKFP